MENAILEEVRTFLETRSPCSTDEIDCAHCGRPIDFVNITFQVYGESEAWTVRLPICLVCES
jgi:hypothetical protein